MDDNKTEGWRERDGWRDGYRDGEKESERWMDGERDEDIDVWR